MRGTWKHVWTVAGGGMVFALLIGAWFWRQVGRDTGIRIMPLGDSMTQGTKVYPGYRVLLWKALRAQGMNVNFVGREQRYYMERWGAWGFDADHEGHWGWTAKRLLEELEPLASEAQPDIVLLQIGINDLFGGRRPHAIAENIEQIIQSLRGANPRVAVLVAQLPPVLDDQSKPLIPELNREIIGLATRLDSAEARVLTVDQYSGYDAAADTYDWLHPNEQGGRKMAERWFSALLPVLAEVSGSDARALVTRKP
ncbi:MAG: SGNH/GDSL hydrolase family protein [Verrucomicrobia bacterium]|nr:SGNH/GDSL hydrolase family protein [Verrucomicrobiota bacterium]